MIETLIKLWKNDFIKGGTIFTIASFVANIFNYFFNLLAARALGPAGYGEIATLFSYASVASVPVLVMTYIVIEKIGARGAQAHTFALALNDWFLSKLRQRWFLIIALLIMMPLVPIVTNMNQLSAYALIPFLILSSVGAFYAAVLQGLHLFVWIATLGIATSFLKLTGALLAMGGVGGLEIILIMLFASVTLPLLTSQRLLIHSTKNAQHKKNIKITKRLRSILLNRQVIITFASLLAVTALINIDIIYVKKAYTAAEAGIYSSWSLLARIIFYATGPISMIGYTFFTNKKSKQNHEKILSISLMALSIIAIISYIFYTHFSHFIIALFFGDKFDAIIPYLGYASLFGAFYTAIMFINNYFLAKKSAIALTPAILLPIYVVALIVFTHSLEQIMQLNVIFALIVTLVYLVAYVKGFSYNGAQWKKKPSTS